MFRFVAPAGAPIGMLQVLRSVLSVNFRRTQTEDYREQLSTHLGVRHVIGISSGRAALAVILKALQRLRPGRTVVAVPAYTCFTVPAAVVRSGLKIYPVDIDPCSLDFDYEQLRAVPAELLLCVVTSSLCGLVNDFPRINAFARPNDIFVVDDAAQAMGATLNKRPAGTLGDVGFYSLGRGKPVSTIEGGIIVTSSEEIADAVGKEIDTLTPNAAMHEALIILQMLIYSVFLRPQLYWVPNSMPFLKLGISEFSPDFGSARLPWAVRRILPSLIRKLPETDRARRRRAGQLTAALADCPNFIVPRAPAACDPNYIRFPLVASDSSLRTRAVKLLRSQGIGASPLYPSAVCDIPGIAAHISQAKYHCGAAERLSKTLFTLPTHPFVEDAHVETMIKTLHRISLQ